MFRILAIPGLSKPLEPNRLGIPACNSELVSRIGLLKNFSTNPSCISGSIYVHMGRFAFQLRGYFLYSTNHKEIQRCRRLTMMTAPNSVVLKKTKIVRYYLEEIAFRLLKV
jgi:hypothetical protein